MHQKMVHVNIRCMMNAYTVSRKLLIPDLHILVLEAGSVIRLPTTTQCTIYDVSSGTLRLMIIIK